MKLGEMLVHDGRLTEAHIGEAMARQARFGGRLGTNLVELGLVDADTVTVYLGLVLGLSIATAATLDRAKRSAIRLLSPEQAARWRCIPIIIQDRQLIAAFADPLDFQVLDELLRTTGYRVIPRVAPELRIYHYLELFYGVPRPARYQHLAEPSTAKKPASNLPAPLPGLPPKAENPIHAPTPPPAIRARATPPPASPPAPPAHDPREALELDAADLVEELDADDTAQADPASDLSTTAKLRALSRPPTPAPVEPMTKGEALACIAAATRRGEIADAVVAHAANVFEAGVLLLVKNNFAFGWKGWGTGVDDSRVEVVLVPLEAPSMFQVALLNDGFFGPPFPSTLHGYLEKALRQPPAAYAAVIPLTIARRAVNLLYGHSTAQIIDDGAIDGLREVTAAATDGYIRLIAASKKTRAPAPA
ncbi:MAG TPA: hypothetical protein VFG83_14295 [Kofleriaceae bacterium]|nr:hypothetical protein [Kofleriaceae bacterium]